MLVNSEVVDDIAAVLSHNSHDQLWLLEIYENNLGNSDTVKIIKALLDVKSLEEVNISNNNIDDEAADDVAALCLKTTS